MSEEDAQMPEKTPSLNPIYRGASPEQVALALLTAGHARARRRHRRRMLWRRILRFFGLAR